MPLEPEDAPGEAGGAVTGPGMQPSGALTQSDFRCRDRVKKKSRGLQGGERKFTYFTILVFLTHRYLLV